MIADGQTIWLARALPEGGKLISLEASSEHANVARENIEAAGLSHVVEVWVGRAAESLPVLAEEGGFVASVALLLLYGLLFWRLVAMASESPYDRDQLIIIGVCVLIGFQVLVNVGVTLGLAPVTGITLPMVSYGGTSLVSTLLALTVAFVVHRDRYADW